MLTPIRMQRLIRNPIVLLLLAVVLFAPLFEVFDRSDDVEQGSDFVLALLCAFMATGLFLLCRRVMAVLLRLFRIPRISAPSELYWTTRSTEATTSPPELFRLLGTLRI